MCTFEPSLGCQARSSASSRLRTSSLLSPNTPTIGWMVPLRDAKDNLPTHRDTHLHLANVIHRSHIPYLTTPPSLMLICSAINGCHGQGTMRCFVAPTAQQKICGNNIGRVECKLLWLKGKGTRGRSPLGLTAAGRLRTDLGCRSRLDGARRFALGHAKLLSTASAQQRAGGLAQNSAPPPPKPRGGPSALAG